jgi:hypothetical protein
MHLASLQPPTYGGHTHIHTHRHTDTHLYAHTHTHTNTHTHTHTHTHAHIMIHTHTYTHTHNRRDGCAAAAPCHRRAARVVGRIAINRASAYFRAAVRRHGTVHRTSFPYLDERDSMLRSNIPPHSALLILPSSLCRESKQVLEQSWEDAVVLAEGIPPFVSSADALSLPRRLSRSVAYMQALVLGSLLLQEGGRYVCVCVCFCFLSMFDYTHDKSHEPEYRKLPLIYNVLMEIHTH